LSFAWCCFCIVRHFEWFSKSSLTHSTNTVIIFECIQQTLTAMVMCHLTLVNVHSILQLMQKIMTVVKNMYAFCNTWTCVKKMVTIRHQLMLTYSSRSFRFS
jgi:hypothetical protein